MCIVELTRKSIDSHKIISSVITPETGGINIFLGTTRNHSKGKHVVQLEYEAYESMALSVMHGLFTTMKNRWNIQKAAIVHRLGIVPIGEASIVIAVSSAHRPEAFTACRFLIDELKKNVPIWKKEFFDDGTSEWS